MTFKKSITGFVLAASLAATSATAGGMAEPVDIMPVEELEEAVAGSSSAAGLIVPLILIALIAAAASGGGDGEAEILETIRQ